MKLEDLHNKPSGFKTPDNYFKDLEAELHLKSKAETSGFKTPDNYFETVEDNILNKVAKTDDVKVISIFSRRNLLYVASMAAAVALFFTLNINNNNTTFTLTDIDDDTIESYVLDSHSTDDLALLIDDGDTNFGTVISDNALETYIINNTDTEDLIFD